jgi:glutamate carboxypeptidase
MTMTSFPHRLFATALAGFLLAAGPLAAPLAAQAAAPLTPAERKIVQSIDARNAEGLALLERLVNINSGSHNFAGVRKVGAIIRGQLDSLGFTTRWVDGAAFSRAGHLVAEHPGPGPKIVLVGHLDTVFEPGDRFQKFERLSDSTARGPAIIDMKGGDVVMLQALKGLRDAGELAKLNIVAVFDGDEEDAGRPLAAARATLIEAAHGASAAMGFEDGSGDPKTAVISRRGATSWKLTVTGNAGHASQIFKEGIGAGALNEAARIMHEFYQRLAGEPLLAFSGGLVVGGSEVTIDSTGTVGSAAGKHNVISRSVIITGDMRTFTPEQLARTQATMREIVARHLPLTGAEITFDDGYPPMAPTDGNRALLAMYNQASLDVGAGAVEAVDPSRAGAADVAFIANRVPMIIDGIGLSGWDDHSEKEMADLRRLASQSKRAALVILRLSAHGAAVRP